MPSRMYLSPTGVRTTVPPAASTACCSPPFESTDTTSVPIAGSAGSAPARASRSSASTPRTRSPSTTWPAAVHRHEPVGVAVEREAEVGAGLARRAPRAPPDRVAPEWRLMFSPSGWSLMTSTRAPVAPMIRAADRATPSRSRSRDDPQAGRVDRAARAPRGAPRSARAGRARRRRARARSGAAPASSSVRQMSCSSSSSTASSSFSPSASRTLRPLSSAGLCEAETMIPAASSPSAARNASAGVGTTPTTWTVTPRLVAPAAIAATNMSPERRVSWPTTIEPPGPTSRCAVARPSANAVVGLRSTLATPRMPSVPNRRGTADRSLACGGGGWSGAGDGPGWLRRGCRDWRRSPRSDWGSRRRA